jgi:hypothetical protein
MEEKRPPFPVDLSPLFSHADQTILLQKQSSQGDLINVHSSPVPLHLVDELIIGSSSVLSSLRSVVVVIYHGNTFLFPPHFPLLPTKLFR